MADKSQETDQYKLSADESEKLWLAPHWGKSNALFEDSMLFRETVVFRDKSKLIVYEENQYIGEYLLALERDVIDNPVVDDPSRQIFRQAYYSKLLSCSIGDVPSDKQALALPSAELQKWVDAVRKINPNFFVNLDKALVELTAEEKKRNRKRPRR